MDTFRIQVFFDILITHGHGDHYGGAQYIKEKFNAKIMMSKVDSDFMMTNNEGANGPRSPKCTPDIMISDGQKIKLIKQHNGEKQVHLVI